MDGEVVWARSGHHNYWPAIVVPCNGRCNACPRGRRLCVEFFPDEAAGYSCLRINQLLPWKEGLWRQLEFRPTESIMECDYNAAVSIATTAVCGGVKEGVGGGGEGVRGAMEGGVGGGGGVHNRGMQDTGMQDTGAGAAVDIQVDWESPEDSRILFGRCIRSPVLYDKSICAILAAHAEAGIPTFVYRSRDDRWSPGDVFARASVLPLIGIEPHSFGASVKGSKAAGGAVSLLLSINFTKRECVEWFDGGMSINYDGGTHGANQTLLKESFRTQQPTRCIAELHDSTSKAYGGSSKCVSYLADAHVVDELGGGRWVLKCEITPENVGICRAWFDGIGRGNLHQSQ